MVTDLARRLSRVETSRQVVGKHIFLDKWPGMTSAESYRVWYGPDESRWPTRFAKIAFMVNGFLISRFTGDIGGARFEGKPGDFPYGMFEQRSDPMFETWWRILCERADEIRMRRVPNGEKSLYQWLSDVGYDDDGGVNRWPRDMPL